jgi:hypothetical protein
MPIFHGCQIYFPFQDLGTNVRRFGFGLLQRVCHGVVCMSGWKMNFLPDEFMLPWRVVQVFPVLDM